MSRSPRSAGDLEAFRWTEDDGIVGLGGLVEVKGLVASSANDISPDGRIIVGGSMARFESNGAEFEAFRWTEFDGMQALGDLPGGDVRGTAQAISDDGRVIVGASESDRGTEAFRWTAESGMVGLGGLGNDRFRSFATDTSADGSVVVGMSTTNNMGDRAFRWTEETGMVVIDSTPFRGSFTGGVSANGSTIVGTSVENHVDSAFLWNETDGMLILQDLLVDQYGLGPELEGWHLSRANAISADGLAIVGEGTNPAGNREAWLVRLPEPATLALLLTGFAFAMLSHWRRA